MATTFRRKSNRLHPSVYRGPAAYFLTMACEGRRTAFEDARLVASLCDALREAADKHQVSVFAYCFMPDHLHLLVGGGESTVLPDFVHDFKQRTGYEFGRRIGRPLWQKSYYDRVLRGDEDLLEIAKYITGNPVRAGLVSQASDYPFLGSFAWDRAQLVEP